MAPRHISFLSFCAANVFIDFESLYNLALDRYPVHAFFHTYVGASLVAIAVPALYLAARWLAGRVRLPDLLGWRELSLPQVALGAALGAYSHIALDSVMHHDIQPLAPFSPHNALLEVVSLSTLHIACVVLGILGLASVGARRLADRGNRASHLNR